MLTPSVCSSANVLFDERVLGLCKNLDEVFFGETVELDPNRKTTLEFGNQIGWFCNVERSDAIKRM